MRVAVIGAGIVGVATAHRLLDDGHFVEMIDPAVADARASFGNAGWIADMDILPLASAKAWTNLPRWLLDPLGPLAIAPAYLPRLAPWLLRFALASLPSRVNASSQALAAINGRALASWEACLHALGLAHVLRRRGILSVWTDAAHFQSAQGLLRRQAALGIAVDILDTAHVRATEPAFGTRIAGGALYPGSVHVHDPAALRNLLEAVARQRGAMLTVDRVTGLGASGEGVVLHTETGRAITADRVIIAGGARSRALAAAAGDRVPLDTERGYNITLSPGALGLSRPVMFEGQGFVTTPLDTGDRIGGSVEFAGLDAPPDWRRVDAILGRLQRILPDLRPGAGQRWMGFRPSIPDSLPVIGVASGDERIFHAFGHGHYGLTQAAITADIIAALIARRSPPIDIAPFRPQRF